MGYDGIAIEQHFLDAGCTLIGDHAQFGQEQGLVLMIENDVFNLYAALVEYQAAVNQYEDQGAHHDDQTQKDY